MMLCSTRIARGHTSCRHKQLVADVIQSNAFFSRAFSVNGKLAVGNQLDATKSRPRRYSSCRSYSQRYSGSFHSERRDEPKAARSDSLFSSESSLDNVFRGMDRLTPILSPTPQSQPRRITRTASEGRILEEMFEMAQNAIKQSSERNPAASKTRQQVEELYSQLSSHRPARPAATIDAELDRKREQIELCQSDWELLQWAKEEVFGESRRYEDAARNARQARSAGVEGAASSPIPPLQPPAYSQLIALLMETFRDRYQDPHLALAMFEHARKLSVVSYVFGCTTPAYNERIKTLWSCFRDLRGVLESLEEMKANGVMPDARTRSLVDTLRREAGQSNLSMEESEADIGQVAGMLNMIEQLVAKPKGKPQTRGDQWLNKSSQSGLAFGFDTEARGNARRRVDKPREDWKNPDLHGTEGLEFGYWPSPSFRDS